jgi:hypothetical protein
MNGLPRNKILRTRTVIGNAIFVSGKPIILLRRRAGIIKKIG